MTQNLEHVYRSSVSVTDIVGNIFNVPSEDVSKLIHLTRRKVFLSLNDIVI